MSDTDQYEKAASDASQASEVALRHATSMNVQRLEFATELLNMFNRAILVHANREYWIAEDWRAFNVAVSAIDSIGHRAVASAESARVAAQIEEQTGEVMRKRQEAQRIHDAAAQTIVKDVKEQVQKVYGVERGEAASPYRNLPKLEM